MVVAGEWTEHDLGIASLSIDCDRTKFTLQVLDLSSQFGCDNLDWL